MRLSPTIGFKVEAGWVLSISEIHIKLGPTWGAHIENIRDENAFETKGQS